MLEPEGREVEKGKGGNRGREAPTLTARVIGFSGSGSVTANKERLRRRMSHLSPTGPKNRPAPRALGRAGFAAGPLGLGCAHLGSDRVTDDTAVATVRRALELGIDFLDTSA